MTKMPAGVCGSISVTRPGTVAADPLATSPHAVRCGLVIGNWSVSQATARDSIMWSGCVTTYHFYTPRPPPPPKKHTPQPMHHPSFLTVPWNPLHPRDSIIWLGLSQPTVLKSPLFSKPTAPPMHPPYQLSSQSSQLWITAFSFLWLFQTRGALSLSWTPAPFLSTHPFWVHEQSCRGLHVA